MGKVMEREVELSQEFWTKARKLENRMLGSELAGEILLTRGLASAIFRLVIPPGPSGAGCETAGWRSLLI